MKSEVEQRLQELLAIGDNPSRIDLTVGQWIEADLPSALHLIDAVERMWWDDSFRLPHVEGEAIDEPKERRCLTILSSVLHAAVSAAKPETVNDLLIVCSRVNAVVALGTKRVGEYYSIADMAWYMSSAWDEDSLLAVLDGEALFDSYLGLHIVHELIWTADMSSVGVVHRERALLAGHPMGCLPLGLTPFESHVVETMRVNTGRRPYRHEWGVSRADDHRTDADAFAVLDSLQKNCFLLQALPDHYGAMRPFEDWLQNSNAWASVWVLKTTDTYGKPIGELVPALEDHPRAVVVPGAVTYTNMFHAASSGGAYSFGMTRSECRLAAWLGMAAMTECSPHDHDALVRRIDDTDWLEVDGTSPWFGGVAWDVCHIAINVETGRMIVVAASDTD